MPARRTTACSFILNSSFVAQEHAPAKRRPKDIICLCCYQFRPMHWEIIAVVLEFWDSSVLPPCHLFRVTLENESIENLSSSRYYSNYSCNNYCSTFSRYEKVARDFLLVCNLANFKLITCKVNFFLEGHSRNYQSPFSLSLP